MTSEHGPVMPLEQKCVRPGEWLIEGYTVRHVKYARPHGWWWRIAGPAPVPGVQRRTLAEIRDWIRDQVN